MSRYQYAKPRSIEDALLLMERTAAYSLLAGGTDLLVKMKLGRVQPGLLIDVSDLDKLQGITLKNGRVCIGAAVTHTELSNSPDIQRFAPALAVAAGLVGSPQIRNRGTIGGNIGNASPAADTIPALLAYDAIVTAISSEGLKEIPLAEFFTGPGRTVLKPGELMVSITFSAEQSGTASAFEKLGKRKALSISVVNAGVYLAVGTERTITKARIALGSVAATPIRVKVAEEVLLGKKISDKIIHEAAQTVSAAVTPIDDVRSEAFYRKKIAGVLVERALTAAWLSLGL